MTMSTYSPTQYSTRREFLRSTTVAGGGLSLVSWRDVVAAHGADLRKRHKACILLWMQGAPSQLETFDPKPGHANGGETKAIDTSLAGLRISENLPETAKIMDRAALVRSMTTKEGNHQRATYMLHTSYVPTATVRHPSLGAVVAHELPNAECELPAFVRVGRSLNTGGGGYFGTAYDPFGVDRASQLPNNSQPTTPEPRYKRRLDLLGKLETAAATTAPALAQPAADHRALYQAASKMILSSQMQAFDIDRESAGVRAAYGEGDFAAGCLLARRLVETGVPFVEVSLGNWDTHDDNFNRCRTLCEQLDRPLAALVRDLEDRGLADDTLVVWMGEFGRTPRVNPRGGRDHYPRAFSSLLVGGGAKRGTVVGGTDAGGDEVTDSPVTEKDLFQTIYGLLGIDAAKEFMTPIGRPLKLVDGGTRVDSLIG